MKECKVFTINDGTGKAILNEKRHYVEEMEWMEEYISTLLNDGWEVKCMMPVYNPSIQGQDGCYNFYRGGYTIYLEREIVE